MKLLFASGLNYSGFNCFQIKSGMMLSCDAALAGGSVWEGLLRLQPNLISRNSLGGEEPVLPAADHIWEEFNAA